MGRQGPVVIGHGLEQHQGLTGGAGGDGDPDEVGLPQLLGGNGAGKSTTLGLLAGLRKPQRGQVTVSGSLGMLPQNPQTLFVKKTVREDLFEIFAGTGLSREEQERRVARMVGL